MSELVDETKPVARKPHWCEDCGRRIEPGEKYSRAFLVGDCGPYTWKRCGHCIAFWHLYWDELVDCDGCACRDTVVDWEPDTWHAADHKRQFLAKWVDHSNGSLYPVPVTP